MRDATKTAINSLKDTFISIHASHAGCDRLANITADTNVFISIHASHAGCDYRTQHEDRFSGKFQSTHPMRDATLIIIKLINFNIISIHASHAGCDG